MWCAWYLTPVILFLPSSTRTEARQRKKYEEMLLKIREQELQDDSNSSTVPSTSKMKLTASLKLAMMSSKTVFTKNPYGYGGSKSWYKKTQVRDSEKLTILREVVMQQRKRHLLDIENVLRRAMQGGARVSTGNIDDFLLGQSPTSLSCSFC